MSFPSRSHSPSVLDSRDEVMGPGREDLLLHGLGDLGANSIAPWKFSQKYSWTLSWKEDMNKLRFPEFYIYAKFARIFMNIFERCYLIGPLVIVAQPHRRPRPRVQPEDVAVTPVLRVQTLDRRRAQAVHVADQRQAVRTGGHSDLNLAPSQRDCVVVGKCKHSSLNNNFEKIKLQSRSKTMSWWLQEEEKEFKRMVMISENEVKKYNILRYELKSNLPRSVQQHERSLWL